MVPLSTIHQTKRQTRNWCVWVTDAETASGFGRVWEQRYPPAPPKTLLLSYVVVMTSVRTINAQMHWLPISEPTTFVSVPNIYQTLGRLLILVLYYDNSVSYLENSRILKILSMSKASSHFCLNLYNNQSISVHVNVTRVTSFITNRCTNSQLLLLLFALLFCCLYSHLSCCNMLTFAFIVLFYFHKHPNYYSEFVDVGTSVMVVTGFHLVDFLL